jgi:hypothetical protein
MEVKLPSIRDLCTQDKIVNPLPHVCLTAGNLPGVMTIMIRTRILIESTDILNSLKKDHILSQYQDLRVDCLINRIKESGEGVHYLVLCTEVSD